jgi:hypothetical protein
VAALHEHDGRVGERGKRAERDERVHVRAHPQGAAPRLAEERPARDELDRQGQPEDRPPLPVREVQLPAEEHPGGHHRQVQDDQRRRPGQHVAPQPRALLGTLPGRRLPRGLGGAFRRLQLVADALERLPGGAEVDRAAVELEPGLAGREVDARPCHPLLAFEDALDPCGARAARHALDRHVKAFGPGRMRARHRVSGTS